VATPLTYTLTGYKTGVLLLYYRSGMQKTVPPLDKRAGKSCPLVPALLALFEKIYIYRHGVLVESIPLAVGRPEFNPCRVGPKDLKSWYSQFSCLTFSIKG